MKRKFHISVKVCALAMVLTMAAACENPYLMQLKDEFGWTEARMLRDGWLKTYPIAQPPVYCYRTLADSDCFRKPKWVDKERPISSSYRGDF